MCARMLQSQRILPPSAALHAQKPHAQQSFQLRHADLQQLRNVGVGLQAEQQADEPVDAEGGEDHRGEHLRTSTRGGRVGSIGSET
eukprot:5859605-Pleurochrysis_carterae.AAC.5